MNDQPDGSAAIQPQVANGEQVTQPPGEASSDVRAAASQAEAARTESDLQEFQETVEELEGVGCLFR